MSFKISKIVIGKGKTVSDEKAGIWERKYFEIECLVTDESQIELAKGTIEALLDSWLSGNISAAAEMPKVKGSTKLPFDVSKIAWQNRENEKGKFQVSEDFSSPDHKALLAFLNEHTPSKCVQSEGWFYWIYPAGDRIGRKLRRK